MNEKYDLLEGFMIIEGYPHKGATFLFSVNNNHTDKTTDK